PKWSGRCGSCGSWNSLIGDVEAQVGYPPLSSGTPPDVQCISQLDPLDVPRPSIGISEMDRVLSGGLVPGSVTLLGGEPGVGKSTLLLQLLAAMGGRTLYATAEESAQQVRLRAVRLGALHDNIFLLAETSLPRIRAAAAAMQPDLLIVDSIQAVSDPEIASGPGSVTQVRGCAQQLVADAKSNGLTTLLVGHVTKEGTLAGPRVLEHLVDTVLSFDGERHHALRMLRAVKHRFGTTNELGLFEMEGDGLRPVPDASKLFLADRRAGVPGSVVAPVLDGYRPLLVEVQALVTLSALSSPRRSAQGFDHGRLAVLLAVLDQRAGLMFGPCDVYASVVGGIRLTEPGGDLAVCVAAASAVTGRPVSGKVVVCGEVGLAGELRQVSQTARRLTEAARLGFTTAIVPRSAAVEVPGLEVIRVGTLAEALHTLGLVNSPEFVPRSLLLNEPL
ncbi:MAG: DNA repair protein RadA, partial [Actinomycetota bacterium]